MFSVLDQCTGRFVSLLTPFADGPRHAGQFSADSPALVMNAHTKKKRILM
jgi:hypothetical protein